AGAFNRQLSLTLSERIGDARTGRHTLACAKRGGFLPLPACGERAGVRGTLRYNIFRDPAEHRTNRDVGAFLSEDFGEGARSRRVDFEGYLVGFEFGDGFIKRDRLAGLLEPFRDRRLGNRFTEARYLYLDRHRGLGRERIAYKMRLFLDVAF